MFYGHRAWLRCRPVIVPLCDSSTPVFDHISLAVCVHPCAARLREVHQPSDRSDSRVCVRGRPLYRPTTGGTVQRGDLILRLHPCGVRRRRRRTPVAPCCIGALGVVPFQAGEAPD
jgi:hypothetical protein